jgi:hypothetical protein
MNSNQTNRLDEPGAPALCGIASCTVMPALVAGIHVFLSLFVTSETWMAGTQARLRASSTRYAPAMTMW